MSTDASCIIHPQHTRALVIRMEYLGICRESKNAHCAAALLSALEHWTNFKFADRHKIEAENRALKAQKKSTKKLPSIWVFMSADEWVEELQGLYGERSITQQLKWLEEQGFICRRNNRANQWDRTLQYLLKINVVQRAVWNWATSDNANDKVRTAAIAQKRAIDSAQMQNRERKKEAAIPQVSSTGSDSQEKEERGAPPLRVVEKSDTAPLPTSTPDNNTPQRIQETPDNVIGRGALFAAYVEAFAEDQKAAAKLSCMTHKNMTAGLRMAQKGYTREEALEAAKDGIKRKGSNPLAYEFWYLEDDIIKVRAKKLAPKVKPTAAAPRSPLDTGHTLNWPVEDAS